MKLKKEKMKKKNEKKKWNKKYVTFFRLRIHWSYVVHGKPLYSYLNPDLDRIPLAI